MNHYLQSLIIFSSLLCFVSFSCQEVHSDLEPPVDNNELLVEIDTLLKKGLADYGSSYNHSIKSIERDSFRNQSHDFYNIALELALKTNGVEDSLLASIYYQTGRVELVIADSNSSRLDLIDTAILKFNKATRLFPEFCLERSNAFHNLGKSYSEPNYSYTQNDLAIDYFKKAIEILEKLNISSESPKDAYKAVSELYLEMGEFQTSIEYYQKSIPSFLEAYNNNPEDRIFNDLPTAYLGLAKIYTEKGDFEAAMNIALQAEQYWSTDIFSKSPVYITIGNIHDAKNNNASAIVFYEMGLNELDTFDKNHLIDRAKTLNNLGNSHTKIQNWEIGRDYLFRALSLKNNLQKKKKTQEIFTSIASSYDNIGTFYLAKNQHDSALYYFNKAIKKVCPNEKLEKAIDQPNLVIYLSDKARTWEAYAKTIQDTSKKQDYLENAYKTYQQTDELIHILLDKFTEESQLVWIKKARSIYASAISVSHQLFEITGEKNYLKGAFQFAESNKAIILQRAVLKQHNKAYQRPKDILNSIRKKLTKSDVLIEYFRDTSILYIFSITETDIELTPIPFNNTLHQQISNYNSIVRDSSDGNNQNRLKHKTYIKSAFYLYQKLLPPLIKNKKRLIIVPDAELFHLTFAAFLSEAGDTSRLSFSHLPYLIKKFQITYNYSAGMLLNAPIPSTSFKNFNIYAPFFDENSNLPPLTYIQDSIHNINDRFGNGTHRLESGDVSSDNFYQSYHNYSTLLLATHAELDENNPSLGRIKFIGKDLTTRNIYDSLSLNGKLVILAACRTGIGQIETGEGTFSLARAFLYKGSSSVISSLWSVDDEATYHLLYNLFEQIHIGKNGANSLHEAQRKQCNKHPFYWAAFSHYGEWTDNNEDSIFYNILVYIGILAIIILLLFRKKIVKYSRK